MDHICHILKPVLHPGNQAFCIHLQLGILFVIAFMELGNLYYNVFYFIFLTWVLSDLKLAGFSILNIAGACPC